MKNNDSNNWLFLKEVGFFLAQKYGLVFPYPVPLSKLIFILICLYPNYLLKAQNAVASRDTLIITSQDTLKLSGQHVIPHTVRIEQISSEQGSPNIASIHLIPTNSLSINSLKGWIIPSKQLSPGTYIVHYKQFTNTPSDIIGYIPEEEFTPNQINTDSALLIPTDLSFKVKNASTSPAFWETSQLRKNGSLSRGLVIGNNRSASVTSGLRLQLEGDLGDGLNILGNITDENIPIQPDGTTQQISDFDRIFIQLQKDPLQLTIGDYEVSKKNSRFANFYRNVQGLKASYQHNDMEAYVSGAVAKGKFQTNSFQGLEGVSGPYRLSGENGERFIFVLAGSERVYLNGKLMIRGAAQDYIIDYNTAEITFTAKHVITSAHRIVVDFEYNDRQYNRSLILAGVKKGKPSSRIAFDLNYAIDADNPNASFEDPEIFNSIRDSLSTVGDDNGQATISGINRADFDENEVRYAQRDTIIRDSLIIYYEFSTEPEEALFQIFFSFVGPGQGNYVRDRSGINNNVFKWVPPSEAGIPQGDYAPLRTWVLPEILEVLNAQSEIKLTDNIRIYTETGISIQDQNRLSDLDDDDNIGLANLTGIKANQLAIGDSARLSFDVSHQYVSERYENLDRIYRPEYDRVWNLLDLNARNNEHITKGSFKLDLKQKLQLGADIGLRSTNDGATALRQVYAIQSQAYKWLEGNYTFTRINNDDPHLLRVAQWDRHEGDIFRRLGPFKIGTELWLENRTEKRSESISEGSFKFTDLKPYIRTFGDRKLSMDLSWNYRRENEFFNGRTREKSIANTYSLTTSYRPNTNIFLQGITSFRDFRLSDSVFAQTGLSDAKLVQSQLQGQFQFDGFRTQWIYEIHSEQVSRREIRYIEVNPGQGQFEWEDFNQNGIQDVDEFRLAVNPLTANFIRVQIPSRELFPTTRLSLKGNVQVDLRKLISYKSSDGFLKKLLSQTRLVSQINLRQNKNRGSDFNSYLINIRNPLQDDELLDAQYSIRQDLTFFPNSPGGDVRFSFQDNQSKLFLNTGNEFRGFKFGTFKPRVNFDAKRSIDIETRLGNKFASADSFTSRNFNIHFIDTQPQFNLQLNRKVRLSLAYQYSFKKNRDELSSDLTTTSTHKAILDTKWNVKDRNNIFSKFELVYVNEIGEPGFTAAYELREGLQPGLNGVWQAFFTYYILSNVELSINYDGRVSTDQAVIHTARMQVRAFF